VCAGVWHVRPPSLGLRRRQPAGLASVTTAATALSAGPCTAELIAAAFPVAAQWRQPRCCQQQRVQLGRDGLHAVGLLWLSVAASPAAIWWRVQPPLYSCSVCWCVACVVAATAAPSTAACWACVCDDCGRGAFGWAMYSCGERSCVARRYSGWRQLRCSQHQRVQPQQSSVAAAAVSCVAHSRSESCRDLVARAAAVVQLQCVLVCGMCGRRDCCGSVDCSLLGLRL
jgi:hypothetical protein